MQARLQAVANRATAQGGKFSRAADCGTLSFEVEGKNKIFHLISSQYARSVRITLCIKSAEFNEESKTRERENVSPVSYTHLDVYKRQL